MRVWQVTQLNGWQRLWILVSLVYLIPVAVVAFLEFPSVEGAYTDALYSKLKPESLSRLAVSALKDGSWFVDPDDVGTEVRMPTGYLLPFKRGVTDEQMG